MFAIIDIETCGGRYEFRKGRITEICIIRHDGLSVVDQFTTLINPECNISSFFVGLSGITNEMVQDAPKFHEVAQKIIELTEGCIFVAHNVNFDYGFIKEEFAALGYTYKRETLCTVRLSRKLIPGRISYSLGHLCASLGIEIEGRHRAEGDAVATVQLFELLLRLKGDDPKYKNMGVEQLMSRRIDKIKKYILDKLPEKCGVYYFLGKDGNIIYIGKSTNMYNRALSHFNNKEKKGQKMLNDLYNVDYVETGSELIALLLESEEIKKHQPRYNRARKSETFNYNICWWPDEKGILHLQITDEQDTKNTLRSFTTYGNARESLDKWVDEYDLCLRFCHLVEENSVCFHHQIKKCHGICAGVENPDDYNQRVNNLITQYQFPHPHFIIIDKGRNEEEKSVVLIRAGKYMGYTYIDQYTAIHNADDFTGMINNKPSYSDSNDLVMAYFRQNKSKIYLKKI